MVAWQSTSVQNSVSGPFATHDPNNPVHFKSSPFLRLKLPQATWTNQFNDLCLRPKLYPKDRPKIFLWMSNQIKSLSSSNQIFHYTRYITPKRATSLRGPFPRHCTRTTQLLSKKYRSGGEPLATLCLIWPTRDLNLRPPGPETKALPSTNWTVFF